MECFIQASIFCFNNKRDREFTHVTLASWIWKNNVYGWEFLFEGSISRFTQNQQHDEKKKHGRSKQSFFPETTSTTIKKYFFVKQNVLSHNGLCTLWSGEKFGFVYYPTDVLDVQRESSPLKLPHSTLCHSWDDRRMWAGGQD